MDGNGLGCLELKTSDDVDAAMKLDQSEFKNSLMEDGVTITVARPDDFKSPEPAADGSVGSSVQGEQRAFTVFVRRSWRGASDFWRLTFGFR